MLHQQVDRRQATVPVAVHVGVLRGIGLPFRNQIRQSCLDFVAATFQIAEGLDQVIAVRYRAFSASASLRIRSMVASVIPPSGSALGMPLPQ